MKNKIILLMFLVASFKIHSLTFVQLPKYQDLINSTELIVEGTVVSFSTEKKQIISYRWSQSGDVRYRPTFVITEHLIEINQVLKGGNTSNILKIWAPFGCYEGKCIVQDNSYTLKEKEKVILFLRLDKENLSDNDPVYWVNGHSLGLFNYNETSGSKFIENYYFKNSEELNLDNNTLINEGKKTATKSKLENISLFTTIEDLKEMINED